MAIDSYSLVYLFPFILLKKNYLIKRLLNFKYLFIFFRRLLVDQLKFIKILIYRTNKNSNQLLNEIEEN